MVSFGFREGYDSCNAFIVSRNGFDRVKNCYRIQVRFRESSGVGI